MSEPTNVLPGEITEFEEHVDDNKFDVAMNRAIMTHLLKRGDAQLTLGLLCQAVGKFQADQILIGKNAQAVADVSSENMRIGYDDRIAKVRAAAEEQAARKQTGEKDS